MRFTKEYIFTYNFIILYYALLLEVDSGRDKKINNLLEREKHTFNEYVSVQYSIRELIYKFPSRQNVNFISYPVVKNLQN